MISVAEYDGLTPGESLAAPTESQNRPLLKHLRAINPNLKIIFVSGYAEEAFAKSLPQGQQFSFLPKPFTLKQLVGAVKETMRG